MCVCVCVCVVWDTQLSFEALKTMQHFLNQIGKVGPLSGWRVNTVYLLSSLTRSGTRSDAQRMGLLIDVRMFVGCVAN